MNTSTKISTPSIPRRAYPMPLWLQGALELFLSAVCSLLAVCVLLFAVWFAGGFDDRDMLSVIDLSAQIWQLIHGVPLVLNVPTHGSFAAISGTVSLIPLGLTLIPLALCFRSGRRLAQASYEGQFWVPTVAGTLTYALFSAALSMLTSTETLSSHPLLAAIIPCWVVLLGLIGGGWYESRSLAGMIGVNAAEWVSRFSQYSRWAGSYVWAVARSSVIAFMTFIAGGALLFTATVFYNWNDILALYQSLHAGAVGDTAVTLLQLGFVPNFVVWAMAWSTGAGFLFGEGTIANLQVTDLGALPNLPILGAVPVPVQPLSYLALTVPLVAGAVAGWWFFRAGENHFDEWISLKLRLRWLSWLLSTLGLALLIGALTGAWTALLGWFAHGSLGLGRLTTIGPQPLFFGLLSAGWIALGVVLGSALAPLIEKDTSGELDRFADPETESEKERKKALRAQARTASRESRGRSRADRSEHKEQHLRGQRLATEDTADIQELPPDTQPASVIAMNRIFAHSAAETLVAEPTDDTGELSEVIALPWNSSTENETAEEPQETEPTDDRSVQPEPDPESIVVDPRKPKLSRGRVIRRPQSRRNRD